VYPFQASTPSELDQHKSKILAMMGKLDLSMGLEIDTLLEVETELCKCHTCEDCEGWCGSPRKFVEGTGDENAAAFVEAASAQLRSLSRHDRGMGLIMGESQGQEGTTSS
jgi:hypothetical protein